MTNFLNRKIWLVAVAVYAGFLLSLSAADNSTQKITFLADDGQSFYFTRVYELRHAKAVDIVPFVRTAVKRCRVASSVTSVADTANNRELLIVSTKEQMLPYVDEMVKALDRPGKLDRNGSLIEGDGYVAGVYKPNYRGNEAMRDLLEKVGVTSGSEVSVIKYDPSGGMFYFKDTAFKVGEIKDKLAWLDKEIPQTRVEFKIYEVRESDLRDIGIDYLAWKNGPGLNLFEAGYEALNLQVTEALLNEAFSGAVDILGNSTYGFGGFYTAPAFDFSFVRLLQQNGKATINSTATAILVNNGPIVNVAFSPEYQRLAKSSKTHQTEVKVGTDASLNAVISGAINAGNVVSFLYELDGSNVVERNNMEAEISDHTITSSRVTLDFENEKIITDFVKTSKVEQVIGIPFLSSIPWLKYLFSTTTSQYETVHYIVTAKAYPLKVTDSIAPGATAEFDELIKESAERR